MSPAQAWKVLGIARTTDLGAIRKAYADKLKASDPDADPAAYAALRDARDMALGWARSPAARAAAEPVAVEQVVAPEPVEPPPPPPPPPPTAVPIIATDAPVISVPAPEPGTPMKPLAPDFTRAEVPEGTPLPADPWARPTLAPEAAADPAGMVRHGPRADQRLWNLLYANGESDTAQMSPAELAAAREALREVLADAAQGDLSLHGVIDNWLASTLAGSWPRCAPLLEDAAAAFGWEQLAGKLGEPPAVAFLNARLKGLRFQDKVLDPAHPLNRAWKELQREGRANFIDRLRTGKQDVRTLLDGVRKNFPELEDHLDPQRVASWEQGARVRGPNWGAWVIGGIMLVQLLIGFSHNTTRKSDPPTIPQISASEAVASADYRLRIDDVVHEVFGKEASADWMLQHQPVLMAEITREIDEDGGPQGDNTALKARMVERVRERLYENGRLEKGENFELAMKLHLAQLQEARSMGAPACATFRQTDDFGSVEISVALREQERAAALKFAESGNLGSSAPRQGAKAMVPGALVERVMTSTGLGHERVAAAMQGKGTPEETCAVTAALLEETLNWHGKERTAILKTL